MKNIPNRFRFIRTIRSHRWRWVILRELAVGVGDRSCWGWGEGGVRAPCSESRRQWAASSRRVNIILLRVFRKHCCHVLARAALLSPDYSSRESKFRASIRYRAETSWTGASTRRPSSRVLQWSLEKPDPTFRPSLRIEANLHRITVRTRFLFRYFPICRANMIKRQSRFSCCCIGAIKLRAFNANWRFYERELKSPRRDWYFLII